MVLIRGTLKVLKKVDDRDFDVTAESSTALGDWYANLLSIRRARLVLLVSDRSLLSVLVPARDWSNVIRRFREALSELLSLLGVSKTHLAAELREMEQVRFARTASRSVLGSMIDLAYQTRWMLGARPGMTLGDVALELSRVPCGPIAMQYPRDVATARLAGRTSVGLVN